MTIEYFKVDFLLEMIKIEIRLVTPAESTYPGDHIQLSLSQ